VPWCRSACSHNTTCRVAVPTVLAAAARNVALRGALYLRAWPQTRARRLCTQMGAPLAVAYIRCLPLAALAIYTQWPGWVPPEARTYTVRSDGTYYVVDLRIRREVRTTRLHRRARHRHLNPFAGARAIRARARERARMHAPRCLSHVGWLLLPRCCGNPPSHGCGVGRCWRGSPAVLLPLWPF
jgi:hypothetical protein